MYVWSRQTISISPCSGGLVWGWERYNLFMWSHLSMHYTRQPWAGKESSGILPLCLCMYACMYENTVCRRLFMAVFWRTWKDIIYPLWSYPSKSFSSMPWIKKEIHGLNCARRACCVCMYISMRSSVAFFTRLKACEGEIISRPCKYDNGSSVEGRARIQSPHSDRSSPCPP